MYVYIGLAWVVQKCHTGGPVFLLKFTQLAGVGEQHLKWGNSGTVLFTELDIKP